MAKASALQRLTVVDLSSHLSGPYCAMLLADHGADVIKIERPDGGDDARAHAALRGRRERPLHDLEPQQALGRHRPQDRGRQGPAAASHRRRRRADREFPARHARQAGPRLADAFGPQPAPDLRRHLRLRPDRPLSRARRLRPHHPGHVGTDERDGSEGRAAASHADRHLGCGGGHASGGWRLWRRWRRAITPDAGSWSRPRCWSRPCPSASTRPRTSPPRASGRRGSARRIAAARPTRCSRRPTAGSPSVPRRPTSGPGCATSSVRPSSRRIRALPATPIGSATTRRWWRCSSPGSRRSRPPTGCEALEALGIPAGPVLEFDEAMADPHIVARGMVVETEHPAAGTFKTLGIPVKLSDTPGALRRPAPRLGEHTAEVLDGLASRHRNKKVAAES